MRRIADKEKYFSRSTDRKSPRLFCGLFSEDLRKSREAYYLYIWQKNNIWYKKIYTKYSMYIFHV